MAIEKIKKFFLKEERKRMRKKLAKKLVKFKLKFRKKNLKKKICFLHIKSVNNNFFLTLTDTKGKVLTYCSSGMVRYNSRSKKIKNSVNQVIYMVSRIARVLKQLYCKNIKVFLKIFPSKHVFFVFNMLKKYRINIVELWNVVRIPHHLGKKLKKPRRI